MSVEEVTTMSALCPGQDTRKWQVEYRECPNCRAEIEFFARDVKLRCDQCGAMVYRERMPSCIDWCPAARYCVGEQKWKELKSSD